MALLTVAVDDWNAHNAWRTSQTLCAQLQVTLPAVAFRRAVSAKRLLTVPGFVPAGAWS
jgi:hypothetical protein